MLYKIGVIIVYQGNKIYQGNKTLPNPDVWILPTYVTNDPFSLKNFNNNLINSTACDIKLL
jgi:hypothetical protein